MATMCCFNGVRLWKNAKTMRAMPAAQGMAAKQGMSKRKARVFNRSPNALYEITVFTSIPPVTEIDSDYGRQATHHLYNLQTQAKLVAQSRTFGHLAWVVDDTKKQNVTSGGSGADTTVTLNSFANWTPVVGELVLLRNPTTGDGFVGTIEVVGAGPPYTIRVDCQRTGLDRTTEDVTVGSGWRAYPCAYYFPMSQFLRPVWRDIPSQAEDKHSFDVQWQFRSEEDAVYSTSGAKNATLDLE